MRRKAFAYFLLFLSGIAYSQEKLTTLSVEKIMRDPKWIGTSPSNPYWSYDSKQLFFNWNPDKAISDSLYSISLANKVPQKITSQQRPFIADGNNPVFNNEHTAYVYSKEGDIYYADLKSAKTKRITHSSSHESDPQFSFNESAIVYTSEQNLFSWDIATGETAQLTNLKTKNDPAAKSSADSTRQTKWLANDRQLYFEVLRYRKNKADKKDAYQKSIPKQKDIRAISTDGKNIFNLTVSPDGRFITYGLEKEASDVKYTVVPAYVTQSGFTEDIPARDKVGSPQSTHEFYIYDRQADTLLNVKTDSIPGVRDLPGYLKDYPFRFSEQTKNPPLRTTTVYGPYWSPKGKYAVVDIRSDDNKDRWLMLLNTSTGKLKLLDRQHDEAWVGGPGTGNFGGTNTGWISENEFWFQSEATGYSHLYSINVESMTRKAFTSGSYEVQQASLSADKKYFYITTNEVNPGEQQFYRLNIAANKTERITTMTGGNQVSISPDEKYIAILYSYSNKPWELYLQENKPGGKTEQITNKAMSDEFKSYAWRDPELITFTARDGAEVHARLFKPSVQNADKPAVVFVHGAGYLQNAHKWWSYYYHEFMFHNLLADNGYYVIDIDYRGSAGYGRDWRTGIYRHMGGKDLDDNVDAADYLVKKFGVNPKHIGLYGGSYGGFITLMALFTTPDVFAAGAALRPVTNWANYNHGYTSNILNEPFTDSISYRKSSPLYFAEGLKGNLLICHGMVDVNVHFQDAVELTQRLIELGKDNWELAPYPMEDHGFVEPSSWTDEYKRIYKLFERVLKPSSHNQ
ncbi:MAG: alpha/beta fold hydrolase [Bacteroidota bacterium]